MKLEIACFNVESALLAYKNKVEQLEICENMTAGGTTPSYGCLKLIRELIPIHLKLMIRPRAGSFIYSAVEIDAMKRDIELAKKLQYNGIVLGCLNYNNEIDKPVLKELIHISEGLPVTFHRAFDRCENWKFALEILMERGCNGLLTSGGTSTALLGLNRLKEMKEFVGNSLEIIPGGGIRSENVAVICQELKPTCVHSSAFVKQKNTEKMLNGEEIPNENEIQKLFEVVERF